MIDSVDNNIRKLYKLAYILACITIFYNFFEGLVSVFLGFEDETISLFGFGLDSFVEVISGIGIWHMIIRIQKQGLSVETNSDIFERQALRITGTAFYILFAGLIISAILNIFSGQKPETTFWGIIISIVSIASMWLLIHYKLITASRLGSKALYADAACTKTCMMLSFTLLIASVGYELTGIGYIDSLGAIAIAFFSFKEGKEAFEKSRGCACSCSCSLS